MQGLVCNFGSLCLVCKEAEGCLSVSGMLVQAKALLQGLSIFEGSKDAGRKLPIRNLPKLFFPPPYFPRDFKVTFAEIHLVAAAGASCVRAAPNASIA